MDTQKQSLDMDPLAKALQGIVDAKDGKLAMAKRALQAKDNELFTNKDAFAMTLQAKDEQLATLKNELSIARQNEYHLRQLNASLMAAQMTQVDLLAKIHSTTPPTPPMTFFELELKRDPNHEGWWVSKHFETEDSERKKSTWLVRIAPDGRSHKLYLSNRSFKKVCVSATYEVLGKKLKMNDVVMDGVESLDGRYKNVSLMPHAEFRQATQGLDKIEVRAEIHVHGTQ